MNKTVKWLLISAGALVFLALIAIVIILIRFDYNALKPRVAKAVYNSTGRELTMAGDIKLRLGLTPHLTVENVTFENADWGTRPEMATVKRLEVQVALIPLLSRDIQVKKLVLIGPDILIETDKSGKSNLAFEQPSQAEKPKEPEPAEGKGKAPALTFDRVRIENGRLTYKDGKSEKTHTASLVEFTAEAADRGESIKMDAKGAYNENPFELAGTVGSLAALSDAQQPWPLKLRAETLGTVINIDGSIKDVLHSKGIDLNVNAQGQSVVQIATFAGMREVPDPGPFTIAGRLTDPAAQTYRLADLKITVPDSDLSGSLDIALGGKRPKLAAALVSQKIDLRSVLVEKDAGAQPGAEPTPERAEPEAKRERVFSEHPLPLDVVRKVDGKVSVQAGQILLPRLALNDVSMEVNLDDGSLTAKPIKASTGGGTFDGQIKLVAKGESADMDVVLKIDQLALGQMLAELGITDRLEGNLDADVELAGRGASVADIMAGLNGTTIMTMEGGRVNNKYLALLETSLGSGLFNLLNPAAEGEQYTDVNCFVSRFDVKDGMAKTTVLLVDTSSMTVVGDGTVNLQNENLSISLVPSPKKGIAAEAGSKVGVNLGELVRPFKFGGTLASPKLAIDTKESAIMIGKAVGGTALFGPAGVAAALMGGASQGKDPCSAALKIAETGEAPKGAGTQQQKGIVEQLPESLTGGAKDTIGGAQEQLKKFFGK